MVKDIYHHFHPSRDVQETDPESGALTFGTIAKVGSVVAPIIGTLGSLIHHFTGGDKQQQQQQQQQQRDFEEFAARAFTSEEITSLLKIGSSVTGAAVPIINDFVDHFTHKNSRTINDLD